MHVREIEGDCELPLIIIANTSENEEARVCLSLLFLIRVFLFAVVAKVAQDQSANASDIVWQLRTFYGL